ncbi:hypothetical protein CRENBAI_010512 [Crenichthys baileyi]|uniref:Uncharacterized protein n=1 Tax=Crenichthys baileyi TaxID=28760 RepID=A0AAV9SIZ5_9TELE
MQPPITSGDGRRRELLDLSSTSGSDTRDGGAAPSHQRQHQPRPGNPPELHRQTRQGGALTERPTPWQKYSVYTQRPTRPGHSHQRPLTLSCQRKTKSRLS